MRLINVKTLKLETFVDDKIPSYAILSHTWGDAKEEVSFQDVEAGNVDGFGNGTEKLKGCCKQAQQDGLRYAWIDTCCIDKTNSVELGEAINSMFKWYRGAACCYAYLADVPAGDDCRNSESRFFSSRWFRRGWTLQELLAPEEVRFYNQDWISIGSKGDMSHEIEIITDIPGAFLLGWRDFRNASIAQRMSWAAKRETSRREDIAYCLLGIFDVMMPMIYGEGDGALIRLQQEIMRKTGDHSILSWGLELPNPALSNSTSVISAGMLASKLSDFAHCRNIASKGHQGISTNTFEISGGFLRAEIPIHVSSAGETFGLLNCGPENDPDQVIGIPLHPVTGIRLNEHIRPQDRSPIIVSKRQTKAVTKTIHLQIERQTKGRDNMSRQYWLHLAGYQKLNLSLQETYPPLQWEQQRAVIAEARETDAPSTSQYLARFRTREESSDDIVLILNFEVQSLQPQARCHVMTLSRDTALTDLSQNLIYMRPEAFGWLGASLDSLNVKFTVQEEHIEDEPLFVIRLARTSSPPKVMVNANLEFQQVALKLDFVSTLLEEGETKLEANGSAQVGKGVKTPLDGAKRRLEAVEGQLIKLNKHERLHGPGNWLETIIKTQLDAGKFSLGSKNISDSGSASQGSSKAVDRGQDSNSQTPLAWAMTNGHEAAVKLLLEKAGNLETKDENGDTLLISAASSGHEATVRLLLSQGANAEARDKDSQTALLVATRSGHKEVMNILLERGADLETTDENGDTPLICAARNGDEDVAKILLKHGANPEAKDRKGSTPLLCAANNGHDAIVKTLLDMGMDVEMRDKEGSTPLIWAAYNGYETVVKLLLAHGADIEAKNKYGNTPLLQSACKGHEAVTRLLLNSGADVKARNGSGNTPLLLAAGNGHQAVIRLLIEKRASVNVKNKYGDTPLSLASNGHYAVVKLLRDNGAKSGLLGRILR